jgi:putative spermidine/putrescine transport system ATP-binding protein
VTAAVSVDGVSFRYPGTQAGVHDATLSIAPGELVVCIGPSGCGKTTLLRLIAGFLAPDQGTIRLDGRDVGALPTRARECGIVFQSYALFPHMSVARNVGFPLKMRGRPRAEIDASVARVLGLVGLRELADRQPRQLSGGQQQRVALARALVFEPAVLLLDEPLGALDKNLREQLQVEIKRIQRTLRVTTVYVTHDQTEAMTLSDRIVVFNRGAIEQAAPPLEVYQRPASRFVAAFVGDSNFFSGTVVDAAARRVRLDALELTITTSGAPGRDGDRVDVLIRPERLRLVERGALTPADPLVQIEVDGTVNHGESVLVLGSVRGQRVRVRVPGHAADTTREGSKISITWTPDDAHAVASEGG